MDLRKLKKYLLILLISIIFLVPYETFALTTNYNGTLSYNETTLSNINDNQARINAMNTYFENLGTITYMNTNYNINDGTYVIQVSNTSFSSDTWTIYLVNNLEIQWWWRTSDRVGRFSIGGLGLELSVNFSGNNITSHRVTGVGSYFVESCWSTNENWTGNPMNEDIEVKLRNYFDTYFLNSNQNINFTIYGQSGFYDIPLKLGNLITIPTNYVNAKEFFDSLMPIRPINVSCNLQPLGVVKNVSSFTYEVSGIGNALNVPLTGQFVFVGRGGTPLLTNDYNIQVKEKNNEDIEGRYEFQCNDEDIGNGCMLKYEYNYIDDIDTPLILQFTFTSMTGQLDYEYSFYSCNVNNSKMNYTYIDNIGGNNQIVENPSLENSINDDNITESDNFLNDNIINNSAFNQDHGLTAIIQAPINFLQSLSSKTCSNIVLPIPHLGNATIPCMSSIYSSKFNELYNILKIIINGVLCYRMALSVVMIVKGAKDPDNDKIEVMDL